MHAPLTQSVELAGGAANARTARELALLLAQAGISATVDGDDDALAQRLANFDEATTHDITFIRAESFARRWRECGASVALISESVASAAAGWRERGETLRQTAAHQRALIVVRDADLALNEVLKLFAPPSPSRKPGTHPTAVVHPSARMGEGVHIGPHCVVEAGAVVGDGVALLAGTYIGHGAHIGPHSLLQPGVKVLDRCRIGASCMLHSGVIIGADGFGYRPSPDKRGVVKVPHIGDVVIGDDVEIGANSCVDRAKFGSTTIGSGTKIDNLVQVAHNCRIGRSCIICGQAGLAGSVVVGDGAMLGARAAIIDNVTIGAGAKVASRAGVMSDVPPGTAYMGNPAVPAFEAKRAMVRFMQLGRGGKKPTT